MCAVGAERAAAAGARLRAAAAHARLPAAARGGVHPGDREDVAARRRRLLPHQTVHLTEAVRPGVPWRTVCGSRSCGGGEEWCSVSIYVRCVIAGVLVACPQYDKVLIILMRIRTATIDKY